MNAKHIQAQLTKLALVFGNTQPKRREWYFNWVNAKDWDEDLFEQAVDHLLETQEHMGFPLPWELQSAYDLMEHSLTPGGRLGRNFPRIMTELDCRLYKVSGVNVEYAATRTGIDFPEDMALALAEAWREYETGQAKLL